MLFTCRDKMFLQGRDPARLGGNFGEQYREQFLAAHLLECFKQSVNRPKSLQIWSAKLVMAKSVAKYCSQYFPLDVPDLSFNHSVFQPKMASVKLCSVIAQAMLDSQKALVRIKYWPSTLSNLTIYNFL